MIKVKTQADVFSGKLKIWIYEKIDRERVAIYEVNRQNGLTALILNFGENETLTEDPTPTFIIPMERSYEIMKALTDAFGKIGIVASDFQTIKNELKATRYHLEDMRSIVFGKKQEGGPTDE